MYFHVNKMDSRRLQDIIKHDNTRFDISITHGLGQVKPSAEQVGFDRIIFCIQYDLFWKM